MAINMAEAQCAAPSGQILYGFLFEVFSTAVFVPTIILSVLTILTAMTAKKVMKNE
jgi:hypothetical protein